MSVSVDRSASTLAGAFFFTFWLRVLGPGIGALLLLVTGALGIMLNTALQLSSHVSVGASTAVFGAVGLLAGVAMLRPTHAARGRRRPWVVAAASLALLALLGTGGERTDVWAHGFGVLVGAGIGAGSATVLHGPPSIPAQCGGALIFAVGVWGAWRLALG